MRRRPTPKDRTRFKTIVRHLPGGNPDQKWFEAHPDRKFRIRPKRSIEPGSGYLIIRKFRPGCRLWVSVGLAGDMLADTDETLGKMFDIKIDGKEAFISLSDGTVRGRDKPGS